MGLTKEEILQYINNREPSPICQHCRHEWVKAPTTVKYFSGCEFWCRICRLSKPDIID